MKRRGMIALLISIVAGLLAGVMVFITYNAMKNPVEVLVAKEDIPAWTVIREDNFNTYFEVKAIGKGTYWGTVDPPRQDTVADENLTVEQWKNVEGPVSAANLAVVKNLIVQKPDQKGSGAAMAYTIPKGTIITHNMFTPASDNSLLVSQLGNGAFRAYPLKVEDQAVAMKGIIKPGDKIDLLARVGIGEDPQRPVAHAAVTFMEGVEVIGTDPEEMTEGQNLNAYILKVSPYQAQKLKYFESMGVTFVLTTPNPVATPEEPYGAYWGDDLFGDLNQQYQER